MIKAQKIIDDRFVACPHCTKLIDLDGGSDVSVDSFNLPNLSFCSWKCLGLWITDVYIQGKQFEYGLEVINE